MHLPKPQAGLVHSRITDSNLSDSRRANLDASATPSCVPPGVHSFYMAGGGGEDVWPTCTSKRLLDSRAPPKRFGQRRIRPPSFPGSVAILLNINIPSSQFQ